MARPVGRIDFFNKYGVFTSSVTYDTLDDWRAAVKENADYYIPMSVVLYPDKDGTVPPHDFLNIVGKGSIRFSVEPEPVPDGPLERAGLMGYVAAHSINGPDGVIVSLHKLEEGR